MHRQVSRRFVIAVLGSLLLALVSTAQALEEWPMANYLFVTFDLPLDGQFGSVFLEDVNSHVDIVGTRNNGFTQASFLLQNTGTVTPLQCPGAGAVTSGAAINRWGEIAGTCSQGGTHQGFLYRPSARWQPYTFLVMPTASQTYAYGLNDYGQVVGIYYDQRGGPWAYVAANGQFFPFGAFATVPMAISNWGAIVGYARGEDRRDYGLLYYYGLSQTFDVPGAHRTLLWDINDRWQIVGFYTDSQFEGHSFLYDNGQFFDIVSPDPAVLFTDVSGINNHGQIVGRVILEDPTNPDNRFSRGFLASPLPASVTGAQAQGAVQASVSRSLQPPRAARPRLQLNLEGCEGGPDTVVPLKLRHVLCQQ
jgi:probable HAF family extracellular repeat protein